MNKTLREQIEEEIVFLSDHWTTDDKKPFHFGGWKHEVIDSILKAFEQTIEDTKGIDCTGVTSYKSNLLKAVKGEE